MNTPEQKLETAVTKVASALTEVKAWYKQFPFYAGLIVGAIVGAYVWHFITKL